MRFSNQRFRFSIPGGRFPRISWVHFCLPVLAVVCLIGMGCKRTPDNHVVIYTSQDVVFAKPILDKFEKETGIKVLATYDSEAAKTIGLARKLMMERNTPRCDVFWSNEELKARQLVNEGILSSSIKRSVYRFRHIVFNTNLLDRDAAPHSSIDLVNPEFEGKASIAFPLYGTTGNHFQGLRLRLGLEKWEAFCQGLVTNKCRVVDGNSHVVKLVGSGQAMVGITDSDDVQMGLRNGLPIDSFPDLSHGMRIFNTVATVNGCPNPDNAEKLIAYLTSMEVNQYLIDHKAADGFLPFDEDDKDMDQDPINFSEKEWNEILSGLDTYQDYLTKLFKL